MQLQVATKGKELALGVVSISGSLCLEHNLVPQFNFFIESDISPKQLLNG